MSENQLFRRKTGFWLLVGLFVTGCAGWRGFELKPMQNDWILAVQHSEQELQKARTDYIGQKILREYLVKSGALPLRPIDPEVKIRFRDMEEALNKANGNLSHMISARAALSDLAQGRVKISSRDPDYARVTEMTRRFGSANSEIVASLAEYRRASDKFSALVGQRHWVIDFRPSDFQKRVKHQMTTAQDETKNMQKEIENAHQLLSVWANPALLDTQKSLVEDMEDYQQLYSRRAENLPRISREMLNATAGHGHVSNLDALWARARVLIGEFNKCAEDMALIRSRFQHSLELFRDPLKRSR
jgi:hypothetical protein